MTNRFVAVKVLELDSLDYVAHLDNQDKEENLRQILQEIEILKQLRDVKARNINLYLDAFSVLGQFWIVNDYCPGGSAKTLVSTRFVVLRNESFVGFLILTLNPIEISYLHLELVVFSSDKRKL